MNETYRTCTRCVMDITDHEIEFDENGFCNHCRMYFSKVKKNVITGYEGDKKLESLIAEIKRAGKNKKYDCLIGISGGVDSTYLMLLTKQWGLRPLAVHFDNGWNSELAVKNIQNVLERLDIDLYTLVVEWEEFKDLQLSYLRASVVDIEVPTDHALLGTFYKVAKKQKIRYFLIGCNYVTEAILPMSWHFDKKDHVNLIDIHKNFGKSKLKTLPLYNTYLKLYSKYIGKVELVFPLDFIDYNYREAKDEIESELGWKDYGGKHCESIFTRFYQRYILYEKFNIDKRKAHLSTLICSGQISREDALKELSLPPYKDIDLFKTDYEFVIKKLGLSESEFHSIMNKPIRPHKEFLVVRDIVRRYPFLKLIRPIYRGFKKIMALSRTNLSL